MAQRGQHDEIEMENCVNDGSDAPDARAALVRAATELFARRGIDGVSLREITRNAGQRNSNALQYHFTNREGLLAEILNKHGRDVGARRNILLDQYELEGRDDLRDFASALVLPLVAKLADSDGGRDYLQITAELLGRTNRSVDPDDPVSIILFDPEGSLPRWRQLVAPRIPAEALGPPLHRRYAAMNFVHLELSRRARDEGKDHALFTSYLTDLVAAVLGAPVSAQTLRVLATRQPPSRKSKE